MFAGKEIYGAQGTGKGADTVIAFKPEAGEPVAWPAIKALARLPMRSSSTSSSTRTAM